MAVASASAVWEVESTGNDANGGGFNPGNANFPTDGTVDTNTGNTASPVFSSASYNFAAGDVGAWLFIKSGTNSYPGWYQIASVASNKATLTASIGSAILYIATVPITGLNTAVGIASVGTPTSLTWGLDYSQQTGPAFTFTDMVIDGTTNTKFTSAAFPVGKNFIGNVINITSGTGFTVQRVEVVSTVTTTATCNASLGTVSSTGGNGKLGGAVSTIQKALDQNTVSGMTTYVKATATYSISVALTWPAGPTYTGLNRLTGYTSTRADKGKAVIQASAGSFSMFSMAKEGISVENFEVDGNSQTSIIGIEILTGVYGRHVVNCKVRRCTSYGIKVTGGQNENIRDCEVTACSGTAAVSFGSLAGGCLVDSWIHDNTCTAVDACDRTAIINNLITNNTGGSSYGISALYMTTVIGNTIHGNGSDGVRLSNNYIAIQHAIKHNIITLNGGFGIKLASAGAGTYCPSIDWNILGGGGSANASGPLSNIASGVHDVTLTGDPYTSVAGNDFTLDNTASEGAACRALAETYPGGSLSYRDAGALQHQDAGGGAAGMLYVPNMAGT